MNSPGYVVAIRKFFEGGLSSKRVTLQEIKDLSREDREELGSLCKKELEKQEVSK